MNELERLYEDKIYLLEKENVALKKLIVDKNKAIAKQKTKSDEIKVQEYTIFYIADEYKIRCETVADVVAVNDYYKYWNNEELLFVLTTNGSNLFIYIKNEKVDGYDVIKRAYKEMKEITFKEWEESKGLNLAILEAEKHNEIVKSIYRLDCEYEELLTTLNEDIIVESKKKL